jgi:hypothetical protein
MGRAYTQRVEVGSYYTDGIRLAEVIEVCALGAVDLRDTLSEETWTCGIDAFRRKWWLAREPNPGAGE